jgi:NAD(P)-dependent dehydrogenase (short-subunit alcohol dehydrogenase family)
MSDRFEGRVAIITGASADPSIGRETARRLASEGASLVVNARREKELAETVAELRGRGQRAVGVPGSALDAEIPGRLVDTALESFGRLDFIVNTVGGSADRHHVLDIPLQGLLDTVALNVGPSLALIQAAVRRGLPPGSSVVNVTSRSPVKATPNRVAYAAAKAALDATTNTLAVLLARDGIRVNSVAPGLTRTTYTETYWASDGGKEAAARHPLGKLTEASHIAAAIAFLLSQDAEAITGVVLDVDMGDHISGQWSPVKPET